MQESAQELPRDLLLLLLLLLQMRVTPNQVQQEACSQKQSDSDEITPNHPSAATNLPHEDL